MALTLDTDRQFQEKWWKLERASWLIMLVIVLAALAGFTGRGGPIASAEVDVGDRKVTYPRVARWQTATGMDVEFPASQGGKGEILIPSRFASLFAIESVTPQPASVKTASDGMLFEFELEAGDRPKRAEFALRPVKPSFWTSVRTKHVAAPPEMSFIILP